MLENKDLRAGALLKDGKDGLIEAGKIAGGISCGRNGLEYINMRMWVAGRAWKEAPVRGRSSEMKALGIQGRTREM